VATPAAASSPANRLTEIRRTRQSGFDTVLLMRRPPFPQIVPQDLKRRILKDGLRENEQRDAAFRRIIRSVPKGKVSTYGKVAAAAGYPLYQRAVARLLRRDAHLTLPWQRIVGAGGEIKLKGEAAAEQRLRLSMEGVKFRGKRVDMENYEHTLRSWETLG
jgi:methylated-DNA-protein-cysteine methyltransferase-like protein